MERFDSVELVKSICKERKIAISTLEKDCGFSNGYIRGLKEGVFPSDRIYIVAQYLNVPTDYLITGDKTPYFNEDIWEVMELMNKFNEQQKTAIIGLMRSFAN